MPEISYRISCALFWLVSFAVRFHYQKLAYGAQRLAVYHQARERMHFYTYMTAFLIIPFYFMTTWIDAATVSLPTSLRLSGVAFLLGFVRLFIRSHASLGINWSGGLEIHEGHNLITSGPYRHIRHPMYAAFYLSAIGFFLLSANWLIGATNLASLT